MESSKRAVILAAVLAFLRIKEKSKEKTIIIEESRPISAWRLSRKLDLFENDVTCFG
ncbi:MAG: hypothetical protein ACP5II_00625 [Infirmifilum sp.]|jgi:hypothetical protein|uniref:hypothetical protein n=1 Tax=Infirmifilum TaxID=2856573 RepID=UPI000B2E7AEF|nr:hypothetical protein [Infirmifilum uzonense]